MTATTITSDTFLNSGYKITVPHGYASESVALTQAAANAASADYTVKDLIALIDAAQIARTDTTTIGGTTVVDA